ncbi:MAG TPA: ribonuclease E/G, partial [Ramlibacter sp.]|nr:ribonuclease E/G [Ramlibacter sp.]
MKRMLINATQAEERRLAIVDGQKLLDYEIEIEGREQRKGNIYKAVVTRVEPSLEACFVDYGEDRHGFLPFKEISRTYFQGNTPPSQARINEVIKEGQELLVQVEKEERGNKGAALTTYMSLAGRYCVLMPNTARGGGISRKITNTSDRKRLKTLVQSLDVPHGMGLIVRTAGAKRTKLEIKRDYDYLLRVWETIRETTLKSNAPALIYEEEDLVKRAIRDLFDKDFDGVLVEGEEGYKSAKDFMRMIMPSQARKIQLYKANTPLFARYGVEDLISKIYSPIVPLKSGGYLVINQAEALVA